MQTCFLQFAPIAGDGSEVAGVQVGNNPDIVVDVAGVQATPDGAIAICGFNVDGNNHQVCLIPLG